MKNLLLLALLVLGGWAYGQKADDIVGIWWNEEKDGRVEVFKKGDKYYGKIEYIKKNENPDGSSPKKDLNNPDEKLRDRVLMGTVILKDLEWDGTEWEDGEIYDSKSGNTYSCFARLQKDGTLYFKGYIGFSLIGRSTIWTRYR
jgi:uncharacterized protein (DUF2147 family)